MNYRPISLILIFGKIFGRLMYNSLYVFHSSRSGFRDSVIDHLLPITRDIYQSFEVKGVFYAIFKAFD